MGKGIFGIGKKEGNNKKPNGAVFPMIRLITEGGENVLCELLEICESYFGASVLSVVRNEDRQVLATTAGLEEGEAVGHVAKKIKNVDKRYHYLKDERNGLFFREGVGCIRVYPLKVISGESCFLMVEQRVSKSVDIDKVLEVLAIAIRIYSMNRQYMELKGVDSESGLRNRDALIRMLNEEKENDCENYLALYHIPHMTDMILKEGKGKGDVVIRRTANILTAYFSNVYRVGESKFCVWSKGKKFDIVCKLQDALDELMKQSPHVAYGCIMCPGTEVVYKALYQCEKVSESRWGDMVIVLKDVDSDFEQAEMYDSNPYMKKCEKSESTLEEESYEREDIERAAESMTAEESSEVQEKEEAEENGNEYVDVGFMSFTSDFEEDFGWDSIE